MEYKSIQVEVVFAYYDNCFLKKITINQPLNIEEVIKLSGVLERYPEIDLTKNKVGIYSRTVKLNDIPKDGDRIEIYRELLCDPKEIRRKKAQEQRENAKNKKGINQKEQL